MAHKTPSLAIIGTVGLPAKYGGFETLVEQLMPHIENDFDVTVYCSGKFYSKENRKAYHGKAKLKYLPFKANGIQSIPYDILSIIHAAFKSDMLLILGVSGCLVLPFVKFFTRKKVFVNIDGIEWKRNKWNFLIKTFLRYSEIVAVETSEAIITDNQVITDYMKTAYNYNSHLIEYGGDQAKPIPVTDNAIIDYHFLSSKYAFTVCRIEPENHIHILLEAMSQQTQLQLVIIGNWKNSEYGLGLKQQYEQMEHINLLDPIYDLEILNTIRSNCYVYLHGHSAGGTNPSLVEAMNLGLPIIAYDVMYNKETTESKAIYFKNEVELLEKINQLDDGKRKQLSQKMLEIAKRRYTWEVIANKYKTMLLEDYSKSNSKSKVAKV